MNVFSTTWCVFSMVLCVCGSYFSGSLVPYTSESCPAYGSCVNVLSHM